MFTDALLTIFVSCHSNNNHHPFSCFHVCVSCQSSHDKSKYAAHFFPDIPFSLLFPMSLLTSWVSPCYWSRRNVLSVKCRHHLILYFYLHLYCASSCNLRPPLWHSWPSNVFVFSICICVVRVKRRLRPNCASVCPFFLLYNSTRQR